MPTINPFWATWHTWLDLSLQVSEAIKVSERLFREEPLLLSRLRFLGETYMVNKCWTGPGTQGLLHVCPLTTSSLSLSSPLLYLLDFLLRGRRFL